MSDFRFPSRVQKLRERIAKDELDALFVSNGENRRYVSGFVSTAGYLLVTRDEAVICTDFRYTEQAAQQAPGWRVDRIGGKPDWLPKLVNEFGIENLGFEADDMTVGTLERFKKALEEGDASPELKPTTGIGVDLRAYKDAEELGLLQQAIDIGDQAFEETAAQLEVGMTEKQAAWIFEKAVRERGAESISFETIVAIGPNAARPHHATSDSRLVEGQTIVFDCGARYQGYCSDLTRTVVLGEADDEVKRVYDIVLTAQLAAIDMVEAGMTGEECDAIARKIISEAGHENDFGHSLGHGLGLEVHENPGVGPNAKGKLENGMPFTIEPGIYIPGWGGVRIEDVVVLENDKARVMSHAAKMKF
ncbi:MAG: aminopeptidase P family protein [Dehalococcoidia bacterium]|nr:aminopeptidase P family protein [Dehalococcoidia bacterium]